MATYSTNVVPPRRLVADDLIPPDSPSDSVDKNKIDVDWKTFIIS